MGKDESRAAGWRPEGLKTPNAQKWICLAYHDITNASRASDGAADYYSVSTAAFGRQLDLMMAANLRGSSIAEAIARPEHSVGISFDDGDIGQATNAFPALAARNMTATFFVTTSWIGTAAYASWDQLREMRAAGMSIQSHTHSHPFLSELDEPHLRDELKRSRELLDEKLGQRTTMIAFPGGDPPRPEFRDVLAQEGYEVIGTSRWGRNARNDPLKPRYIRRCVVRGDPGDAEFAAIVTGGGWMNIKKQVRDSVLAFLRSSLGPTRYAYWRRNVLSDPGPRPRAS